jgi:hypothetical protein
VDARRGDHQTVLRQSTNLTPNYGEANHFLRGWVEHGMVNCAQCGAINKIDDLEALELLAIHGMRLQKHERSHDVGHDREQDEAVIRAAATKQTVAQSPVDRASRED